MPRLSQPLYLLSPLSAQLRLCVPALSSSGLNSAVLAPSYVVPLTRFQHGRVVWCDLPRSAAAAEWFTNEIRPLFMTHDTARFERLSVKHTRPLFSIL